MLHPGENANDEEEEDMKLEKTVGLMRLVGLVLDRTTSDEIPSTP